MFSIKVVLLLVLCTITTMSVTASIPIPHRRVSTRRGSVSAYDPFAVHAEINENPNRTSSSTLTIVRVVQQQTNTQPITLNEAPSSSALSQRRIPRRHQQSGPVSSTTSPASDSIPGNRLSFAFSSFSGAGPAQGGPSSSPSSNRDHPPSPSSSPRLRPSSPRLGPTTPFPSKPRLTPDQLVDLARQATNPRTLTQLQGAPFSGPSSPAPLSHSPVLRAHSPKFGTSSAPATASVAPATFTPLPADIFLPFVDRPSEVAALISSPPDVKLFSLLAQTWSKIIDPAADQTLSLPRDPARWSYNHLIHHLTKVDRDVAPDPFWALSARKCILSHSELLWERIKGALGIPPELDVDCDFTRDADDDESCLDTDEISDDEGRAASGHWSDWDAVMDSPVFARAAGRLSSESPTASLYLGKRERERTLSSKDDQEANFRTQVEGKLQGLEKGFVQTSAKAVDSPEIPTTGATTISPTPLGARSPPDHESTTLTGGLSPPTIIEQPASPGITDAADYISIEPLLAPLSSISNLPPLSLQGSLGTIGDGLGDIAEGAEEEEEEEGVDADKETALEDSDLISPSQIQGLRISTTPLPLSNSFHASASTPPVPSPISPLPPYPSGQSSLPHSRRSSMSSSVGPFQRSESSGNLASRIGESSSYSSINYASSDAGDSSGYTSDVGYDPVGDRAPGNPLFPSNFARLAVGPTLRAK